MAKSGVGAPPKPGTSTAVKAKPLIPRFSVCATPRRSWLQVDSLSPVQVTAHFCPPAKVERVITNGRESGRSFSTPS